MRAIPVWLIESRAKLVEALLAAKRRSAPNYRWHPVAKKDDHHGAESFCGFILDWKKNNVMGLF